MIALIKHISLIITLIIGLSACGDIDLNWFNTEFEGKWKSTSCETGKKSHSFIQTWEMVAKKVDTDIGDGIFLKNSGAGFDNTIKIWDQPNCPSTLSPEIVYIKGHLSTNEYQINVSTVCKKGKANESRILITTYKDNNQTISYSEQEKAMITGEKIRKALLSQSIGNIFPAYNLMCVDSQGRIHMGDLATGDGSSQDKRPTEMSAEKSYTKE